MASQRSLPFSPSTPTVPVSQRPSQIPSSLSTVGLSTKFESVTTPRGGNLSNSASSKHARTGSAVSSASRPRPNPSISTDLGSPTRRTFTTSHAPGILPPPPFFHPSRPPQPPLSPSDASRRSSVASSSAIHISHEREGIHSTFPLQPLVATHDVTYDSDAHSDSFPASGDRMSHDSMQDASGQPLPMRNQKQSREPLLPTSGHALSRSGSVTTHRSKPSLARNVVEKNAASASAATRVRDSFERFRKGLSLDSVRRSLSGSASASQSQVMVGPPSARSTSNAPTPFEIKESSDEEYKASDVVPLDMRHSRANFIPYPPTTMPEYPLSAVPLKREKSSSNVRNYERIPTSNRWFMRGHLLMGGAKPWAFIGSLTLVFGIAGVWLGTTAIWWWHNESPAVAAVGAYMCLLTISLMLSTVGLSILEVCDPVLTLLLIGFQGPWNSSTKPGP
jgi:palmitoyltransferase ZDHHC9/14/18